MAMAELRFDRRAESQSSVALIEVVQFEFQTQSIDWIRPDLNDTTAIQTQLYAYQPLAMNRSWLTTWWSSCRRHVFNSCNSIASIAIDWLAAARWNLNAVEDRERQAFHCPQTTIFAVSIFGPVWLDWLSGAGKWRGEVQRHLADAE